jgi:hypothetical protein
MVAARNQKWDLSQKKWDVSHFAGAIRILDNLRLSERESDAHRATGGAQSCTAAVRLWGLFKPHEACGSIINMTNVTAYIQSQTYRSDACRVVPGGAGWCRVRRVVPCSPGGAGWCRVVPGGAGWCRVVPGVFWVITYVNLL